MKRRSVTPKKLRDRRGKHQSCYRKYRKRPFKYSARFTEGALPVTVRPGYPEGGPPRLNEGIRA